MKCTLAKSWHGENGITIIACRNFEDVSWARTQALRQNGCNVQHYRRLPKALRIVYRSHLNNGRPDHGFYCVVKGHMPVDSMSLDDVKLI